MFVINPQVINCQHKGVLYFLYGHDFSKFLFSLVLKLRSVLYLEQRSFKVAVVKKKTLHSTNLLCDFGSFQVLSAQFVYNLYQLCLEVSSIAISFLEHDEPIIFNLVAYC